ncbi:glycosyltransferase [[Haemophilus] felis]|nr:glycosyltransferase [[Haemophilus] felis]
MSSQPLVSIITPVHNGERFLPDIYQSLLNQTYRQFEWIIVNDCSKDNSAQIIQQYIAEGKLTIRYVNNPQNLGAALSRNAGLDVAMGKYIAFLDVDDTWQAEKLALQVAQMEQQNWQLSYMDYNQVDLQGRFLKSILPPEKCARRDILKTNHLGNLTCLVRADLVKDLRFIKQGAEDYIFWLAVLDKIDYAYKVKTETPLCNYRISANSLSGNKFKSATWQWAVYRNHLKLNVFTAFYYFCHYAVYGVIKHKR